MSTPLKLAAKNGCFSTGADIGAGIGMSVGGFPGAFTGAGIGGLGGIEACNYAIDFTSEKGAQTLAENLWTTYKNPVNEKIDLSGIETYIESASKAENLIQFLQSNPPQFIEQDGKTTLYGHIEKNVGHPQYTREQIKGMSSQEFRDNEQTIFEQAKQGQIKSENDRNLGDFVNPLTGSQHIYSAEEVKAMSTDEFAEKEKEITSQAGLIGLPSRGELEKAVTSGDVWVESYKRTDGTKVEGYYRSRPR